ncbi:troponin T, skeletal muscle-like isoform X2 [Mytilus californianus]|uniref:troponin T, skeletal muscle-like isoform X2 n=1 Tax=Mytilus californianus TaxID=6549 RepID=UPI002246837B|nr:troponin T, skeletal muscle-like isoform X2 [Mytilus californianus]
MSDTEEAPSHEETQEFETRRAPPENEAKLAMEEAKVRKAERIQQEIAEFEEQRKEEKAKEEEELQQLRERREQRKIERAEEEERLTKLRMEEDVRRRQEERERQARKLEEEQKRKEERERRRKEQEDRLKLCRRPNFVITKKADGGEEEAEQKAEDLQKSKEQLEEEKRAILAQRIQELKLDGLKSDGLIQKAKELHEHLHKLMGEQYDLEDKFKRQQYDMIELTERARSMNKGRGNRSTMGVKIDESFDRLADKFINAPPKIQICSKYERHTDNRSYGDRMQLFEEFSKPKPPPEIIRHGKGGQTSGAEDGEEGGEEE